MDTWDKCIHPVNDQFFSIRSFQNLVVSVNVEPAQLLLGTLASLSYQNTTCSRQKASSPSSSHTVASHDSTNNDLAVSLLRGSIKHVWIRL